MCKFSIVIVCKNEEKNIKRTIESVLAQQYDDWECIVIDGGSEDGTLGILNDLKKVDSRISVYSEYDDGIYYAMNKAIQKAQGEYIYFLNAKDEFFNEHVFSKVSQRLDDKKTEIYIGTVYIKRHTEISEVIVNSEEWMLDHLREGASVCHQAIFAKRDCLLEGFDTTYAIAADYDWLCKQVVVYKRKILIEKEPIAYFEGYGVSSLAKSRKLMWEEGDEIHKKYFGDYEKKDYRKNSISEYKACRINQMVYEWLVLRQKGGGIESVLKKYGIKAIAIYGMAKLGCLLYHELANTEIKVEYAIDQHDVSKQALLHNVYKPEDKLPQVDAVIITPILDYYKIKEDMKHKMDCQYFSLEDLINEAYEELELM